MEMQELHSTAMEKHEKAKQLMNHYSRASNWDEMRRSRFHGTPLHVATGEYIPLQHGSPDLKRNSIYPSQPSPIPAFQMPGQYSPKYIPLQDLRSGAQMSPLSVRTAQRQDSHNFTQQDPEEAVVKISSMFPTVSDTHIRLLLKKYHNREAVVISALQVEKHPIVTPGPFATPPPTQRSVQHAPLAMTPPLGVRTAGMYSRTSSPTLRTTSTNSTYTGSPRGGDYRSSPRPHSSPKLKLRYMKSIFPQAEETIILDVLTSNENNIQRASDTLREMGFVKKDSAKIKKIAEEAKKAAEKAKQEQCANAEVAVVQPKMKSTLEKEKTKQSLQNSYSDIPEHVISIALESVHFDEDRANQILKIMVQEDNKIIEDNKIKETLEVKEEACEVDCLAVPASVPTSQSRQSLKSLLKEKPECAKISFSRVIEENNMNNASYKSPHLSNTNGSNPRNANGANEKLLLEDYIKWQGPNTQLAHGAIESNVKGPNAELRLATKMYSARGPNPEMRKGALLGLSKGSIFSQLKVALGSESRGK